MGRSFTVCVLALGLTACAHRSAREANAGKVAAPALPDSELTPRDAFTCASGQNLATQFDSMQGKLALGIDQTLVRLDQVPSASGNKFSDGRVTFWSKGPVAMLEIDGVRTDCERTIQR